MSRFWSEEPDRQEFEVPDDVVDLAFRMHCPTLPAEHAWALSQAIGQVLPWFESDPLAGLHLIHGADSGNGWERPSGEQAILNLSRRTPLVLRLARERIPDAASLSGQTLDILGHPLKLGEFRQRKLAISEILYSRYIPQPHPGGEDEFLDWAANELDSMAIRFKKILCGRQHTLSHPDGEITTRSLMVGGLSLEHSVKLQQLGLGPLRQMGCGLFIPQKSF